MYHILLLWCSRAFYPNLATKSPWISWNLRCFSLGHVTRPKETHLISWWRLKTNADHIWRILWERERKPVLKQKGKGLQLKTRTQLLNIGSFAQIQKVDQISKLIKINLFWSWAVCRLTYVKASFSSVATHLGLWFYLEEVSKVTREIMKVCCCKHHSSGRKIFTKIEVFSRFLKLVGSSCCPKHSLKIVTVLIF